MKKRILIIGILLLSISGLYSQKLFQPVPYDLFTKGNKSTMTATQNTYKWLPRWEIGLSGVSYELKKGSVPIPLSEICTGISLQCYQDVNNLPFNVWGASLLFLKDTQDAKGFGVGFYGTYNTNNSYIGLVNAGIHYNIMLNKWFADVSLTWQL